MSGLDVAVNLLWCVPGEVGGSEEYLVRQLLGLHLAGAPDHDRDHDLALTAYASSDFVAAHPELAPVAAFDSPRTSGRRRATRIVTEHTWLARRTRHADVVHHGGGTAPLVGSRPIVLTVHDLQPLHHPELHSPRKLRYLRFMLPRSVARAAIVATPTQFVRGTVIEQFGAAPDRVVVVPHGVASGARPHVDEAALRARFGLGTGPFVVYPAITHPHKNHELLIRLLQRHWVDPDLRLVLLGGRGAADAAVERLLDEAGVRHRVVRPGRVSDDDRDALVAAADALVFPSRYEGFGAPLVEAMALGTPVICGDHPAIREVVGDAAVVRSDDVDAWADALDLVRHDRRRLVDAGTRRAAAFGLEASGAALARAYRMAAVA